MFGGSSDEEGGGDTLPSSAVSKSISKRSAGGGITTTTTSTTAAATTEADNYYDPSENENGNGVCSSRIVCTANPNSSTGKGSNNNSNSSKKNNTIELGLIFSISIVVLYLYANCQAMMALPDASPPIPSLHFGSNWNAAITDLKLTGGGDGDDRKKTATTTTTTTTTTTSFSQRGGNIRTDDMGNIIVPRATWPVPSLSKEREDGLYETIVHPGDQQTMMSVPPFWSLPLHNKQLMTRDFAMNIGTCIEPDINGNYQRGDSCPLHQRTIYVGIASYRDFQCRQTVESIFYRAKYPERVRVAVVDQIVSGEDFLCNTPFDECENDPEQLLCKYKQQIELYVMEAELSIGPVFARHIGYRMYRGEYYATQSDAHVTYTQDWDVDIILQLEATHNEMAVLSTYLTDIQGSIDEKTGKSLRHTRPIMCNTVWEGGPQGLHLRHAQQPERNPTIHGMPQLQPWWAAGYSFSRGHFVVNVPYDYLSPMIFQGEEMSIGIRGFTIGYDFYAPEKSVCFHHYAVGKNALVRNKVKHFWENSDKYDGTGKAAMARLLGIVHMNPEVPTTTWDHTDEEIYGIGGVRLLDKFYTTFGIDVIQKTTQDHMCEFIHEGGKMHKMFTQHLRKDGMGIDYSKINYHWVDPHRGQR